MTHAGTVEAFAAALLDPASPLPPGITTARGQPDATRFAVYRNTVFVGLVECLARSFPVTLTLVGEAFFRAMARVYAATHRPATPILARYGDTFPDFVDRFPPAAGIPYLADVARLEVAWAAAYHAADADALAVDRLSDWLPRALGGPVPLHPSARIIRSVHPVGSIWSANATGSVGRIESADPETVLVIRPDAEVVVHRLPRRDAAFAAALFAGASLEDAAAAGAGDDPAFDFGQALVGLAHLGAFTDHLDPEPSP